jgi:hypothetical protein
VANPVIAHLNGGPADDTVVVLPPERLMYLVPGQTEEGQPIPGAPPRFRIGAYVARLNEMGSLVPHDLRSYEFDWDGWD